MLSRNGFILKGDVIFRRAAYGVSTFSELEIPACVGTVENIEFAHIDYASSFSNVVSIGLCNGKSSFIRCIEWGFIGLAIVRAFV